MTTLADLFDLYMSTYARGQCKTWRKMEQDFHRYCFELATKPITEVKRIDIYKLHAKLGESAGRHTANRTVELLCAIFNRCIEMEMEEVKVNPASRIKKFRLKDRERFLDTDELKRLFDAIDSLRYDVTKDFLYMCLWTGCRFSNVAAMRWDEIRYDTKTWHIPDTKNNTSQHLPLTSEALAVLQRRAQKRKGNWVFPSIRSDSGHITKVDKAWEAVKVRSGLSDARIHDLRRTLASWQALTGANLSVIAATLNHKDFKSTKRYARLNTDAVREAMEKATRRMISLDPPDDAA